MNNILFEYQENTKIYKMQFELYVTYNLYKLRSVYSNLFRRQTNCQQKPISKVVVDCIPALNGP